jgi:hypothetical protein
MTSILFFDSSKKKFEFFPTKAWSSHVYEPDNRTKIAIFNNSMIKTLQEKEFIYSIPTEILANHTIYDTDSTVLKDVNVVWKSWASDGISFVGLTENIVRNRPTLEQLMTEYNTNYNKLNAEAYMVVNGNNEGQTQRFKKFYKFKAYHYTGTFFIQEFCVKPIVQAPSAQNMLAHKELAVKRFEERLRSEISEEDYEKYLEGQYKSYKDMTDQLTHMFRTKEGQGEEMMRSFVDRIKAVKRLEQIKNPLGQGGRRRTRRQRSKRSKRTRRHRK